METLTLEQAEEALKIDRDDLDRDLTQEAQIYHHVADQYELMVSERDLLKLQLDELQAEVDADIRRKANAANEKITDTAVKSRILLQPKVKQLSREHLKAKGRAGRWSALLEAFDKRSYALSKLVDRQIAQLHHLHIDRGMVGSRSNYSEARSEASRQAIKTERQERYGR